MSKIQVEVTDFKKVLDFIKKKNPESWQDLVYLFDKDALK